MESCNSQLGGAYFTFLRRWAKIATLSIGEVAKLADIGIETIRFYERKGLIEEPPRRKSGYRQYPEDIVARLKFIRRAKDLGFTLKEIDELLSLKLGANASCAHVKKQTETKIADVRMRINNLLRIQKKLEELVEACSGDDKPTSECPILGAFDEDMLMKGNTQHDSET